MGGCGVNHCSGCGISGSTVFYWASRRMTMYDVFRHKALHWASRRMTMYDVGSNKASRNICIPRQQGQRRYLIYASRSSREGVANACMEVDNSPEGQSSENNASGRRRDRTSSSLPCWAAYEPMGGPGQRSPGPPHPPPWGPPRTLIERRQRTTEKLSYVLVASN